MLTKNLQELIATGSIDKDEPLFQLIHQIQEENSRYLIELNQQAYTPVSYTHLTLPTSDLV